MPNIVLVGYMGSGKSSIGKNLSKLLNLPYFDLDSEIEKKYNLSISTIFKEKGEIWFRKIEHELLDDFIKSKNNYILSLGGGTPCYANNHLLLQQTNITSIYLKASIETIILRTQNNLEKRPLLSQNKDDLKNFIGQHLFERSYFYNFSKYKVDTNNKSVIALCNEIANLIK